MALKEPHKFKLLSVRISKEIEKKARLKATNEGIYSLNQKIQQLIEQYVNS